MRMTTELHDLPIAELARMIAARTLSPVELLDALIQRVEQYDAQLHAFITPTFDLAHRQAKAAAAVAAGMVPVALGSDTGGSIRGPASLCGVVGLMPTFGLVSRAGVISNSYTFDHCGPLARTVEDCALVLQALAGYDAKDAGSLRRPIASYREALGEDLRGVKIGVLWHHWEQDLPASDDVRRAMDEALAVLP